MQKQRVVLRALAATLIVLGVVVGIVGVGTATWWRPDPVMSATAGDSDRALTTAPGVLSLGADAVLISGSTASTDEVVLVLGRQVDIDGWLSSAPAREVTGLLDRETLAIAESTEAPAELPSPAGSDMWLLEAAEVGRAEVSWTAADDHVVLLAATVNADGNVIGSPEVTLSWNVPVPRNWLVPGILVGVVLVGLGVFLLVRKRAEDKNVDEAATASETAEDSTASGDGVEPTWHSAPPAWQGSAAYEAPATSIAEPEVVTPQPSLSSAFSPEPVAEPVAPTDTGAAPTSATLPDGTWHSGPPAWQTSPEASESSKSEQPAVPQDQPVPDFHPTPAPQQPQAQAAPEPSAEPAQASPAAPENQPMTRRRLRELKLQGQLPEEFSEWGEN